MENNLPNNIKVKGGRSKLNRGTAAISRWLHVYLSMLCFIVVLFFSITGLTLNHADWFDGHQVEQKYKGKVSAAWVNVKDTTQVKKLEIVEYFRKNYHIKGYVSDFVIQDDECTVSFKGPGYSADAFITRNTGEFKLTEVKLGLVAVLNDLHKGRDSGKAWGWLIDVSAIFLTIVSLSGLVMLFFLKKKRINGTIVLVIGAILSWLIYAIWVK